MALVFAVIFIIVGVTLLIAFTPLREYIPGYPTGTMRKMLIGNALVVDSLELGIQKDAINISKTLGRCLWAKLLPIRL